MPQQRSSVHEPKDQAGPAEQHKNRQLADELRDIDRRIKALKETSSKPAPFFSMPVFILGLLIVGAMTFAVFSGLPKGVNLAIFLLVVLVAVGGAWLYVRHLARKVTDAE